MGVQQKPSSPDRVYSMDGIIADEERELLIKQIIILRLERALEHLNRGLPHLAKPELDVARLYIEKLNGNGGIKNA